MKVLYLAAILIALPAVAQHYDLLQTKQGDFEDCNIIRTNPAYVVVSHGGSLTRVAITNLPPLVAERIGYDPVKAARAEAAEAARAVQAKAEQAAIQKHLASLAGPVQTVRCLSVQDAYGLCTIQILEWNTNTLSFVSKETCKVYMVGLPAAITEYFSAVNRLRSQVANDADDAAGLKRDAERADANAAVGAAGDAGYVNAVMAQRARANNMVLDAANAAENLAAEKMQLADLQSRAAAATTFSAFSTGLTDNGLPRWQAVP